MDASLASSPWPTRSPEKLPRVSPPAVLGAGVVEEGLSICRIGDAVPRAGEVDLGVREKVSSPGCPNTILPFPPKVNLLISFTCDEPAPCVTAAKPDENEKPLLAPCSVEAAGATEASGLDG